jgi:nitronate monooxygenase
MVVGLIHDIPTCKDLIEGIVNGAEKILRQRLEPMFPRVAAAVS